VLNIQLKK